MAQKWSKLKKALSQESSQSLLKLIKELYDLRPENRAFLEARLVPEAVDSETYRRRVEDAISPDPLSRKDISIAAARQAVREYERAVTDAALVADLMLYYVECGTWFATDLAYGEVRYFRSLERMFAEMLEKLEDVDESARGALIQRIENTIHRAGRTGWGYQDELRDQFEAWRK